jgi:tetratricopeptide (TPR) repeat protein
MFRFKTTISAAVVLAALFIPNLNAGEPASVLLQKGIFAEETEGDLKAAIALYRQVRVEEKFSRSVAAQAQFRLAVCLQKQGNKKEAVAAFRELIAQFPAQEELLVRARKELVALGAAASEIKVRKVMIQGVPAYDGAVETRLGRIAPDARHFSFTDWSTLDGSSWLRVRNLQTGDTMDLTDPKPGKTGSPWNSTWSPDGKSLAYVWINTRENNTHGDELRFARLDGVEPRTPIKLDRGQEYKMRLLDWSADGQFILVHIRNKGLTEVSLSDNSLRLIKALELPGNDDLLQPTAHYSPDGRYIAYDYSPDLKDPLQRDIHLVSKNGSFESIIVKHPAHDYGPSWTPDGKAIVFASNRTGANGIWLVPVANGRAQGSPTLIHQTMGRIHPKGFAKDGLYYYDVHLGDNDLFVTDLDAQTGKVSSEPFLTRAGSVLLHGLRMENTSRLLPVRISHVAPWTNTREPWSVFKR